MHRTPPPPPSLFLLLLLLLLLSSFFVFVPCLVERLDDGRLEVAGVHQLVGKVGLQLFVALVHHRLAAPRVNREL